MLLAYPREFRLEYGSEMTQLFRDCHRDVQSDGLVTTLEFWLRMILDVIRTAPVERWDRLGNRTMKNLKSDAIGLLGCVAIIVVALFLLRYGMKHQIAPLLLFGALDAIVAAGVVSNLIIFPLLMATRLSRFRTALWTLLIVHGALLLTAALIGTSDPHFNFPWVFAGYVVSFLFWLTIHWLWSQTKTILTTSH